MSKNLLAWICAWALLLLPGVAAAQVKLEGDPKVAFIYLSPAHDGGWTESIERGRIKLEAATGVETAYTEDIPEDKVKVRQVIDLYVKRGYNIIVGTAYGYGDAFKEAADAYPNVAFINAAGETTGDNLESFYARTYQGWYLAGMAAAGVTQSKKLGIVAGFPLSVVNWDINAFERGAQAVDPEIKVIATFVNTWFDPLKEEQAAAAMMEEGADVIATDLSAASVPIAVEQAGKSFVGFQNDMSHLAPNGTVTSVVFNWETHLIPTVKAMMNGTWKSPGSSFLGVDSGMVALAPVSDRVPLEIRTKILEAEAALKAGTLTPFDGPLKKQDGTVVVEAGKSLDDGAIWSMDYFVDGIIGTMPAAQ